jgi:hypothetical protein
MRRSVPHGHPGLDPQEEVVEADVEVLQEHGQGGQRWKRSAMFDRADHRPRVWGGDHGLAEATFQATSPQFMPDGERQIRRDR